MRALPLPLWIVAKASPSMQSDCGSRKSKAASFGERLSQADSRIIEAMNMSLFMGDDLLFVLGSITFCADSVSYHFVKNVSDGVRYGLFML